MSERKIVSVNYQYVLTNWSKEEQKENAELSIATVANIAAVCQTRLELQI